jgi:hypothetical protein
MTSKMLLGLAIAGSLCLAGCKKEEEATTDQAPPPPPPTDTGAVPPPEAATGEEVTTYPNMVPERGTKKTLQSFAVYQAADTTSKRLTNLGPNTLIDLKARYGNWMLVEWPCGVAKLCPGWIELRQNDTRVTEATKPDAGTGTDAGTDAGPDAGPTDAGPDSGAKTDAGPDAGPTDAGPDSGAKTDAGTDGGRGKIKINLPTIPPTKK